MLKIFILKKIASSPSTGYGIIKKCREKLGYTPSTGSIYPLLKTMEKQGYIVGREEGRKIVYSISPKGKEFLDGLEKIREEFYARLKSYIVATAEIFNDEELRSMVNFWQEMGKILFILSKMKEEKRKKIIDEFYRRLKNEGN